MLVSLLRRLSGLTVLRSGAGGADDPFADPREPRPVYIKYCFI